MADDLKSSCRCAARSHGHSRRKGKRSEGEEKEDVDCHIPVFWQARRVRRMTKEFPAARFLLSKCFFLSFFFLTFTFSKFNSLCSLFPHFNFSLSLFLRLSFCLSPYILFNLAQLCLLVTYVSWQFSLFGLGNRRKPWLLHVLSFSVLTKHWLFMTANSHTLCVYALIPVFCSVSHFHTFSACFLSETSLPPSFPPFFSLFHSWGQLQLFENRLACCCWVLESEQGSGLTCGSAGEPVKHMQPRCVSSFSRWGMKVCATG